MLSPITTQAADQQIEDMAADPERDFNKALGLLRDEPSGADLPALRVDRYRHQVPQAS
jgi:hypothetical protein